MRIQATHRAALSPLRSQSALLSVVGHFYHAGTNLLVSSFSTSAHARHSICISCTRLGGYEVLSKKPLVSYDRHYKGAQRFLEFRDLFEQRDQIIARARELNLDNDHDYGYFTRSIVPQIESIDARVDFLTRDDADLEKAIEKSAKSYQALARWDMRADRAFESLKGAIGGIGISAIGGILTGITYLLAGPGQTYIVFTGLMLAGLIGVGYSLLYWFPIIVRYAYLFVVRSFKSDNEGSVYPD